MQPYQERVVIEKAELDFRLRKLLDFIRSDAFEDVDAEEKTLLTVQFSSMNTYSQVLERRISNFR